MKILAVADRVTPALLEPVHGGPCFSDIDLIISPPIIVPGTSDGVSTAANTAFATCSAAPVDGAAVTHLAPASTTRRIRAAWHKPSITLVSARLQTPFTGESSFATDPETGISIRYWRGSDISTGAHIHRWDCLYGAENLDPLMGYQISGANQEHGIVSCTGQVDADIANQLKG